MTEVDDQDTRWTDSHVLVVGLAATWHQVGTHQIKTKVGLNHPHLI